MLEPIETAVTPAEPEKPEQKVWGFWPTVGFGLLIFFASVFVHTIIYAIFLAGRVLSGGMKPTTDFAEAYNEAYKAAEKMAATLAYDGTFFAVGTIVGMVVAVGLIIAFIRLKKGARFSDYLALKPISKKQVLVALAAMVAIIVVEDVLNLALGKEFDSDFMKNLYDGSAYPALLWLALVVAAPVFEEFFFRGFLFAGLVKSRLGAVGTILLTSLIWTSLHSQYGLYEMSFIFVTGIVMGYLRLKTGSIYGPLIIHVFNNIEATLETVFLMSLFIARLF